MFYIKSAFTGRLTVIISKTKYSLQETNARK